MKNRVFIIAGGTSISGLDLSKLKDEETIVVNKSLFDVPNPTYFITMDYSFINKIGRNKFQKASATKIFIANTFPDYIVKIEGGYRDIRFGEYDLRGFDHVIESDSYHFFLEEGFSSGKNSGFCAVQYAIQKNYNEIYLLGFDYQTINDETHYHSGYNQCPINFQKKLDEYFGYIKEALEKYKGASKIYSCSSISRLNKIIEYKPFEEII